MAKSIGCWTLPDIAQVISTLAQAQGDKKIVTTITQDGVWHLAKWNCKYKELPHLINRVPKH
jgi:hypothetical protein